MTRKRTYQPLSVFQNGRLVGRLNRETSGSIDFRYDAEWLSRERPFPISLSLPLREDRYIGAPVIAVFDNLLPDGEPVRQHIAERVGAQGAGTFSLLTALGRDCVGALQFLPEGIDPGPAGGTEAQEVSAADIANIIRNLEKSPLGVDNDESFRISIAGAQEKTALLWREGRWHKPTGTTATTHIIKPQIGRLPNGIDLSNSVENEHLCLKLAAALGAPAAETEIAEFEDLKALIVKRFDRRWLPDGRLMRLPQEDFCQALSVASTRKYHSDGGPGIARIIDLLKSSDAPQQDIAAFVRANVIFWLLGATDGHAKNFSVFLNPAGFRLTPLYDVLSSQPSLEGGQIQRRQFKLAMSIGKSRHYRIDEIQPRHFMQTAEEAGISLKSVAEIIEDLRDTAKKSVAAVIEGLGSSIPQSVSGPVQNGILERIERLGETKD
jgi:serine/threonine-protein kinase HipA